MWYKKPPKRKDKGKSPIKERDWSRIEKIREAREEYKRKSIMILNTEDWRSWNYKTKLSLLNTLSKNKVENNFQTRIKHRIISDLKKNKFNIEWSYKFKLDYSPYLNKNEIKKWIQKKIKKIINDEPLRDYINNNVIIQTGKEITLQKLINNRKKTIKDNLNTCNCNNYNIKKNEKGHIHIKAEDLPDEYTEIKKLLTENKKCAVSQKYHNYLGSQLSAIEHQLNKILKKTVNTKLKIGGKDIIKAIGQQHRKR